MRAAEALSVSDSELDPAQKAHEEILERFEEMLSPSDAAVFVLQTIDAMVKDIELLQRLKAHSEAMKEKKKEKKKCEQLILFHERKLLGLSVRPPELFCKEHCAILCRLCKKEITEAVAIALYQDLKSRYEIRYIELKLIPPREERSVSME